MLPKPRSIRALLAGLFAGVTALCLAGGTATAQSLTAGSNINVVGGPVCTSDPDAKNYDPNCPYKIFGDVTAQRQNEGSFDCSSRNSLTCVAAGNDYRLVGIAGPQDGAITGDAWHGIYWTHDGGATWRSTLLPGWHVGTFVDTSPEGVASPIKQFDATADATVRAGTNGMFYISGVAFNRATEVGSSAVTTGGEGKTGTYFMAVYIDDNKSLKPEDGPRFVRWSLIDTGSSGRLLDKPWIAVDIPRTGGGTCTIPAGNGVPEQTIPAGTIYGTYTTFLGEGTNNPHSTVWFKKSTDCGATWSNATKIAEGVKLVQSATIGIFPNGDVLLVWREFGLADGTADRILGAKSTNFGKSFTKAFEITNLGIPTPQAFSNAYDAQTYPSAAQPELRQARSNDYPSLCVDSGGATIAFSKRLTQPAAPSPAQGLVDPSINFSRIVTMSSTNGTSWGAITPVDNHPYVGHQFQPAVACAGGRRAFLWYDQRNDYAFSLLPFAQQPTLGLILTPFIVDGRTIPPAHTVDVRARQTTANGSFASSEPSIQVSKYPVWVQGDQPNEVVQLKYNFMNLPLFGGGVLPFIGDYPDLIARNRLIPPTRNHPNWELNDYAAETPSFQSLWTDNRDVVEFPQSAFTQNQVANTDFTTFAAATLNACGTETWTRNQNLYTSALSSGFIIRTDGNARRTPSLKKRAYALSLYNGTRPPVGTVGLSKKYFKLSFDADRSGPASFSYVDTPVPSITVEIPALSGAARAVFIDQGQTDSVVVLAEEVDAQGNAVTNPQKGRVIIAPDPTAPVLALSLEDHGVNLDTLYFQTQVTCTTDADCSGTGRCEISSGQSTGFCAVPSVTYGVGLAADPSAVFGDPALSSTLDPTALSVGSWGFGSWGFGSWGFGSWGFGSWGFGSWGFGSWGFGSWGFGSWGFGSWGFGSWGFGSTAITTSSFTVQNTGTVESAYDLDTLVQSLPSGSVMQVLVSKIAANPRPTDCNVQIEPTLQEVANASRTGNGALNSSFTLAPNEQAIILVQGSCTPGAETSCYDPQQDLALKVTSQSPDCNTTECVFTVPPDFDIYDVSPPLLTLPGDITAPATGASGAVVTYTATAVDLIDGSRPVTCTPPSGSTFPVGTTTVTCTASDLRGNTATGTFTVTVTNAAPVASNVAVTTNEDTAVAVSLVASDVENDALTFSVVSGPSHGTLGTVSGSGVTYTPNANYNGSDSFTFKATESGLNGPVDSNVATVNITINPVNDAPVANAVGPITTLEDTAVAVVLSASDVDGDALTYTVTAPAHGTLSGTAPNLTYTPALDYNGPDSFTFKVNDGTVDSNVVTVSINVTAVADAPRPNNDSYSTNEDVTLTVPAPGVLSNDTDPEGGPLTATLVGSGPSHAASFALNADGSFTYAPVTNYNGTDSFQYTATDSTGLVSAAATVTITVAPVDDPGIANNDTATVLTGGSIVINVLANDTDPDNTLTIASVSTPQHGTATITNSGTTVTYTSTDATFSGLDTFTYTLVGGGTATVTVQVNYAVTGVLNPQGPPKTNNAGSAIPIDWQYKNASGVAVDSWGSTLQGQLLTLSFTKMYPTNTTNCTGGTEDPAPTQVNTDYPGNSYFQYFGASNPHPTWGPYTWQFNWQTGPPITAGCWKVRIIFDVNQNNPVNAKWQYDAADIVITFPVKLK